MEQNTPRRASLYLIIALILFLSWRILAPFASALLWAGVLAVVAYPLHRRFLKRGIGPTVAALLTTLAVTLVILLPAVFTVAVLWKEGSAAAPTIDQEIRKLLHPESAIYQRIDRFVDLDRVLDPATVSARLSSVRSAVLSGLLSGVGGVLSALVQSALVVFVLFYLIRDGGRLVAVLRRLSPLDPRQSDRIFNHINTVVSASVNGVVLIAALQGALGGIAFAVLGVSSPVLWGIVMFLLSLIPLAGSFVIWAPVALYFLLAGHPIKGIALTLWGIFAIGMLDNLLRPRLVGKKAGLHELLVFFAVLGGIQLFGILGIVVGPVIIAMAIAFLDMYVEATEIASAGADAPSVK